MVNEAVCKTLDYSRGELLGHSFERIIDSEGHSAKPGTRNVESAFKTKDGRSIPVLVSCSAVLDQDGQIDGLVIVAQDITEIKTAERSLRKSQKRLRALMERLVSAQEDERQKVARDLHDGMLQLVIAAELQLSAFRRKLNKQDDDSEMEKLNDGIERLGEAVKEGRRLINNLRPPTLDKFGLVQSIRQEVARSARELECDFEFNSSVENTPLTRAVETTAFRICQEALSNIRKYAEPNKIFVYLNVSHSQLVITVEDDGRGFDPDAVEPGVGLHSMRERSELLRGSLKIESRLERGTKVTSILPLEQTT
jgi:signal transduction histidine kinase